MDKSVRNGLLFVAAFVLLCAFLASAHGGASGYSDGNPGVCSRSNPADC